MQLMPTGHQFAAVHMRRKIHDTVNGDKFDTPATKPNSSACRSVNVLPREVRASGESKCLSTSRDQNKSYLRPRPLDLSECHVDGRAEKAPLRMHLSGIQLDRENSRWIAVQQ